MAQSSKASTGDGLGGVLSAGGQLSQSNAEDANVAGRVGDMMKRMGTPNKVRASEFARLMGQINARFGATTAAQKEAVAEALTYLAIVHGSGPNVQWEKVECVPGEGCRSLMMSEIVDMIITRAYHRRFMVNLSQRAVQMHNSSPELQNVLTDRAIRSGVPTTETLSTIDFLDSSSGISPSAAAYRIQSKYSAVRRANLQQPSSTERSAKAASSKMHEMHDLEDETL